MINFSEKNATLYKLGCSVYFVILVVHFCACIFCKIAEIEKDIFGYDRTWLDLVGIEYDEW